MPTAHLSAIHSSMGRRWRQRTPVPARFGLIVMLVGCLIGCGMGASAVSARTHDLPPVLSALSYPELDIQLTRTAIDVPPIIPAGQVLITVANASARPTEVILARLPKGQTWQATLAAPGATTLPWLIQATYPGSPGVAIPGGQATALVDLTPGQYVAFTADEQLAYDVDHHRVMAGFSVISSPGGGANIGSPSADATFTLSDNAIAGPAAVTPGHHVWRIVNNGHRPHELRLLQAPRLLTAAQVVAAVDATDPTQPVTASSGGLNFETLLALPPAGGLGWLSPGQTAWTTIDLSPGTYVAVDLVRTPASNEPYALFGVATTFTVARSVTAPPSPTTPSS